MPAARKAQVSLEATLYYHCVSRFVLSFAAKITFRAKTSNTDGNGSKFGYSAFPLFCYRHGGYAIMSNQYRVAAYQQRAGK
jgi:hypothetical protein